jgi:hypothetical protein
MENLYVGVLPFWIVNATTCVNDYCCFYRTVRTLSSIFLLALANWATLSINVLLKRLIYSYLWLSVDI